MLGMRLHLRMIKRYRVSGFFFTSLASIHLLEMFLGNYSCDVRELEMFFRSSELLFFIFRSISIGKVFLTEDK